MPPEVSAEDELGLHIEGTFAEDPYAFEFARFWDDTVSDDANIRIINWWLNLEDYRSSDEA